MKIKQLGNGGGLASALEGHVNSAFLIDLWDDHSEYLLFDCGYNIIKRLEEEELNDKYFSISKIKHIIISHKHDDHCGNLETLIYWNHFKNNVQMNIYVACEGLYNTVLDTSYIMKDGKTIKTQTYRDLDIVNHGYFIAIQNPNATKKEAFILTFLKAYHGKKPAIGVLISGPRLEQNIFISGDTKANKKTEKYLYSYPSFPPHLIFHDYSNWDDESKNIHACHTDFEREYSENFKSKAIKYHTGDLNFNKDWQ